MCNFLGSFSPQQRFEMFEMTSVIAQLQLRVLFGGKQSTPSRCKSGPTPKEKPQSLLASSFYTIVSSPHIEPALCKLG